MLLTKMANSYVRALTCPPMNRLFYVPRGVALEDLAKRFVSEKRRKEEKRENRRVRALCALCALCAVCAVCALRCVRCVRCAVIFDFDGFALRAHAQTTFTQHHSIVRTTFPCALRSLTRFCAVWNSWTVVIIQPERPSSSHKSHTKQWTCIVVSHTSTKRSRANATRFTCFNQLCVLAFVRFACLIACADSLIACADTEIALAE